MLNLTSKCYTTAYFKVASATARRMYSKVPHMTIKPLLKKTISLYRMMIGSFIWKAGLLSLEWS